jgi:hypothetical protein
MLTLCSRFMMVGIMGIFVVFNVSDVVKVRDAIASEMPNNYLEVTPGQWFVSAEGTAQEISDRLKISSGESGSAIVVSMGGYYGRTANNVWDWIKAKAEENNG